MKLTAVVLALLMQAALPSVSDTRVWRGTIDGVVTAAASDQPIPGAQVTLRQAAAASGTSLPFATTDSAGKFSLSGLDAGSYTLTVVANGYVRQQYGERYPGAPAKTIALTDREPLPSVAIRLMPAGNLEGHIRRDSGRPMPGIAVRLVRRTFTETGRGMFESVAVTRTDDRGRYRFYWVTPGRYYVVGGVPTFGADAGDFNGPREVYPYTFFPGTTDIEKALALDIRPESELNGIDFALVESPAYRIRARIVDPATGQPPRQGFGAISYWSLSGGGSTGGGGMYNNDTGMLDIAGLLPGSYTVSVTAYEGPGIPTRAMSRTTSGKSAGADVVVSSADVDLGVLRLEQPNVISGRVSGDAVQEGAGAQSSIRILFIPEDSGVWQSFRTAGETPGEDGTFTAYSPHSSVRVVATNLPAGSYVREALLDGKDALTEPARVSRASDLQIVVSPQAGRVEGTVGNEASEPVHGARVAIIPNAARDRFELFKQATTDEAGRFSISGVPPGDYTIYAWEALDPYGYFDPEVLRKAAGRGVTLRIGESSREAVQLTAIPSGSE